jgi:hypothetical protein
MRLVAKATSDGDVAKRIVALDHQPHGHIDPQPCQERRERDAGGCMKRSRELRGAHPHLCGDLGEPNAALKLTPHRIANRSEPLRVESPGSPEPTRGVVLVESAYRNSQPPSTAINVGPQRQLQARKLLVTDRIPNVLAENGQHAFPRTSTSPGFGRNGDPGTARVVGATRGLTRLTSDWSVRYGNTG